ncbi:MAG: DUF1877 family protein, partial [Verrucomicrobiaceae bacterium]
PPPCLYHDHTTPYTIHAMSMILNLARVPATLGEELLQNPEGIYAILEPEEDSADTAVTEDDMIDLDKSWHALHFLFTGTAWEGELPASFLVLGGTQVGDLDVGYGPARYFDVATTTQIDAFLQSLDEATLRSLFDQEKMLDLDIYPQIWDEDNADEVWEYVGEYLTILREFVRATAASGKAMLVFCN